jgi:hypothetical protein
MNLPATCCSELHAAEMCDLPALEANFLRRTWGHITLPARAAVSLCRAICCNTVTHCVVLQQQQTAQTVSGGSVSGVRRQPPRKVGTPPCRAERASVPSPVCQPCPPGNAAVSLGPGVTLAGCARTLAHRSVATINGATTPASLLHRLT